MTHLFGSGLSALSEDLFLYSSSFLVMLIVFENGSSACASFSILVASRNKALSYFAIYIAAM